MLVIREGTPAMLEVRKASKLSLGTYFFESLSFEGPKKGTNLDV